MNRNWLRVLLCGAASLVMGVAFAGQAAAPTGQAAPTTPQAAPPAQTPQNVQVGGPQQPAPPANPDAPPDESAIIRSNVQRVTTPVTVFDSGGQYVYDLEKEEFEVFDNGEPVRIDQFDSEMRRLSLVIVIETNDTTAPFMDDVRPLGSMFSDLVMGPQGEVAVLTYSDRVNVALPFTADGDKLDSTLRGLYARGGGMHLDDALAMALSMLDNRPIDERKVIIIFSDGYNIGSQMRRSEIVKRAMNSNITLYGLAFNPVKGLWKRPEKEPLPDLVGESVGRSMPPGSAQTPTNSDNIYQPDNIPVVNILLGLGEEAKKPFFKSSLQYFSTYSGGKSYDKWDKNTVQTALAGIATEIHSQYEIAYAPPTPLQVGYHKIEVRVRRPGAKVRARAGWFYQGEPPRGVVVK